MLPHAVLKSDAYRSASLRAQAALMLLLIRFDGFNNGRITLSVREAAADLGGQNFGAAADAIGELVARGLVTVAKDHPKGSRKAREYRLTFIETGTRERAIAASNEYLAWQPGDAGSTQKAKKRREDFAAETRRCVEVSAAEAKTSVEEGSADDCKSPPFAEVRPEASDEETSTHIDNHTTGRPAAIVSAAPEPNDLRLRLIAFLRPAGRKAPWGAAGRLAKLACLTDAEVSRFRHGCTDMSPAKRIRLACALPQAEAIEREGSNVVVMRAGAAR